MGGVEERRGEERRGKNRGEEGQREPLGNEEHKETEGSRSRGGRGVERYEIRIKKVEMDKRAEEEQKRRLQERDA